MNTIFLNKDTNYLQQPMFFGESLNVARFDECKYQKEIDTDLTDRELSFFWRPEEVDITRDRADFNERLRPHEQHLFTSNLKYQTLLDSVQTRGIGAAFGKIVSLPELENWMVTWAFYESIHSRSYTHIIRNLYPNPGIIFDDIVINPEIVARAKAVTDNYDRFIKAVDVWSHFGEGEFTISRMPTKVEDLLMPPGSHRIQTVDKLDISIPQMMSDAYFLLADINCLEALRFYVSFACSFAFAERDLMEGNAKIIKFICRDEQLHKNGTCWMINKLRSGAEGQEWARIAREQDVRIPSLVTAVVDQELQWAQYLFKDGAMPGINFQSMKSYMEYLADTLMTQMQLPPIYGVKKNPYPWMSSYTNTDNVQVAPQEVEISSYLTASLKPASADDFSGFSL